MYWEEETESGQNSSELDTFPDKPSNLLNRKTSKLSGNNKNVNI